jgi:hypothetical protein
MLNNNKSFAFYRVEYFLYIYMIGDRFNMEDVFFRDLTICILDTLEGQIKWINRFSSGDVNVEVPFIIR